MMITDTTTREIERMTFAELLDLQRAILAALDQVPHDPELRRPFRRTLLAIIARRIELQHQLAGVKKRSKRGRHGD